ncbi:uncharacterized protein BXZ73DRAFT_81631, partial [Epithele typhae]
MHNPLLSDPAASSGPWPQVGLGQDPAIYPIVVCCMHRDDAEAIDALNATVFYQTAAHDVHLAVWRVQEANISLRGERIYSVRAALEGRHTGVFIGVTWAHIGFQIGEGERHIKQYSCRYKRFDKKGLSVASAIAYMVMKTGHNFPLDIDLDLPIIPAPLRLVPAPALLCTP